jgi:UDP-GlcNAc3NAcA epimerase
MGSDNTTKEKGRYKLLSIIGARPQIIKSAAISRAIRNNYSNYFEEIILHTGQHYDQNMSDIFFVEMEIPQPHYNLSVGSGSHGLQTAKMIQGIEEVLISTKPDAVIVYGDTNSTMAGAIAASKLKIPVVHIEAGLRSFNKSMPEEINRIVCDHTSTMLFTPTRTGLKNLEREGLHCSDGGDNIEMEGEEFSMDNPGVFHTGDVMFDNTLFFAELAEKKNPLSKFKLKQLNKPTSAEVNNVTLKPNEYILATIHRDSNTENAYRMKSIFHAIIDLSEQYEKIVVMPLHPRTAKVLEERLGNELYQKVLNSKFIKVVPGVSFFEMITLEKNAELIITDSGGVQKEAYFLGKPCLILRPQTEWVEIVEKGAALLVDDDYDDIVKGYEKMRSRTINFPPIFGDGKAAENILEIIKNSMEHKLIMTGILG